MSNLGKPNRRTPVRRHVMVASALAVALPLGIVQATLTGSTAYAATPQLQWSPVVNSGDLAPGSDKHFNSFNQPSVNADGVVAFRARTQGPSQPVRGVYTRDTRVAGSPIVTVAAVGGAVPAPNNSGGTFNEFPAFPRIDVTGDLVATRGQSTPVWTYTVNGTDTKVGTSGVYANVGGSLTSGATLLGSVPGFERFSVPGAAPGTRFDQFPGAPAVDGTTIAFKGNYTEGLVGKTGVYFRDLSDPTQAVQRVADPSTRIPNQPSGGTAHFGSTAPPSAAGGRIVFTGWDNEGAPTVGGIYLAAEEAASTLRTVVGIGDRVPGQTPTDRFTNVGEGLSFDGRFVGFWASWGSATTSIVLTCPTDGNADLLAFCHEQYPTGFTTTVPVHQGIFVADTVTGRIHPVTSTGARFAGFQYWVFSGRPPGTGGGDEVTLEPARWRSSAFVAVSGLDDGAYQVAFKASPVAGGSGVFLSEGPSSLERIVTALDTSVAGQVVDPQAPAGSVLTAIGLERDGFRGRQLALSVSMVNATTSESWAGIYLTQVPVGVVLQSQRITFTSVPPATAVVGGSYVVTATADSGLPVSFSIDPATTNAACSITGSTVRFQHAGTCIVDADQAGDETYAAAPRLQQTILVVAAGSSYSTDFTGVTLAPVSDPTAWHMTGPYDAAVVTLPNGNSALRISNAVTSGSFDDMVFSPTLAVPATETGPATTFTAKFDLLPVDLQPGLRVTVSPDDGSGGRAGFLAIQHTVKGMDLVIAGSYVDGSGDVQFRYTTIATDLNPNQTRTVTLTVVKRPNTKKSSNNDTFTVQVQGKPARTTTFEAYYQATGEPNYATDTLLFRLNDGEGFPAAPQLLGHGLYVDNVRLSTA